MASCIGIWICSFLKVLLIIIYISFIVYIFLTGEFYFFLILCDYRYTVKRDLFHTDKTQSWHCIRSAKICQGILWSVKTRMSNRKLFNSYETCLCLISRKEFFPAWVTRLFLHKSVGDRNFTVTLWNPETFKTFATKEILQLLFFQSSYQ